MSSAPRFAKPSPSWGWIAGVADEDLLRQEKDVDRVLERLDVELAVLTPELEEVQRGEVAC
jgi:hypothetical protein